jgi:multiple sugar transport system ATP-binding protein
VEISKSIVLEPFTTVKVKVDVVEALGSENIVNVLIGGDLVKARTPGTVKLEPGEEVYLKINPKKTLIFDKQTGKLII